MGRSRMRYIALSSLLCGLLAGSSAATPSMDTPKFGSDFVFELENGDFGFPGIRPEFSRVLNFSFSIDLSGPLESGRIYDNDAIQAVRYLVRGSLNLNPPTPSGFPAFALNRFPDGEGTISPADWAGQGSELAFAISPEANFLDGIQLSELRPLDKAGTILTLDGREFERLDRARYHPPQLVLNADGTGLLQNSNNSSGDTGTTNPATGMTVDVDFGEEYITRLDFDPAAITVISAPIVPEPGTAVLLGMGLLGLSLSRRWG